MQLLESFRVALTALVANKLRSLLTMLGVIIGVGAVIIMISIIQGARQKVVKDFNENGSNVVFAFYSPKREKRNTGTFEGLTMDDVQAIERRATLIETIVPRLEGSAKALRGKKDFSAKAVGATGDYLSVNSIKVDQGRFFSGSGLNLNLKGALDAVAAQEANKLRVAQGRMLGIDDQQSWAKVCVIGDKVKKKLFDEGEEVLGKVITVTIGQARLPLTVVGVLEYKGNNNFGDGSPDDQILIPFSTMQKRFTGGKIVAMLSARSRGEGTAEAAADQIFAILKARHPAQAQDFIIDTQEGLLKRLDQVLMVFQIVLGGVGFLSLLVGGIGVMNIMLVSVTERTKEIGIRKAVGAKRADILTQFVTESMTVSGVGGLLGVAFGYGISALIGFAMKDQLPTYVPLWAAGLGFGFAVGVGMFFGIYPAVRASKLDPINALRYE